MRPKPSADKKRLSALVERQAKAFQSMPYFWCSDPIETPAAFHERTRMLHEQDYLDSSRRLMECCEFPRCDDETGVCADFPDLAFSFRVGAVSSNSSFPPVVRMHALRTFLPEALPCRVSAWKTWCDEVRSGLHVHYLRRLWAYETTMSLNRYGAELQRLAALSLAETAKWAARPELTSIRNEILASSVCEVAPAPVFYPAMESEMRPLAGDDALFNSIWPAVEKLVRLTRAWDARVKGRWKLRYYENYYPTLEQFRDQANSEWLSEFFDWVDRCCSERMGVFLDY